MAPIVLRERMDTVCVDGIDMEAIIITLQVGEEMYDLYVVYDMDVHAFVLPHGEDPCGNEE